MESKYEKLIKYLKNLGKVAIAFSGGVDSTFLLKACKEALEDNVIAITVKAPYIPLREIKEVEEMIKDTSIEHYFLEMPLIEEIRFNPKDRCYICKKEIFKHIKDFAKDRGAKHVLDGTNFDDTKEYRPGLKALEELEIKSPLKELGFTKEEIRKYSKDLNLNTWDKPSYACLLSRIPYGEEISFKELDRVEKSENYLHELGFIGARVRSYGYTARIEMYKSQMIRLLENNLLDKVVLELKALGYNYVTLDLEGYRSGSMDIMVKGGEKNE
ncbi:ATP-dependent sacrificial sulfur transferase LarE [Clostridium malenominatum]|uniref:ATP-dependent sacrificial sulfur transferase LarE n=1 Tax=Clostridium malenominatum TaxID=1539 RepID=A0ABP3UD65_9CLOT